MPTADHRNVSGHGQQIASGEFVGPEAVGKLDPKDPHDAGLIEQGAFVPLKAGKEENS